MKVLSVAFLGLVLAVVPAGAQEDRLDDSERQGTAPIVSSPENHVFLDVPPGAFFHDAVTWLSGRGITAGCGGGNFCPNSPVTRGEVAVFFQTSSLVGSPLGFAFVNSDGSKVSGSSNVTTAYDAGSSRYDVTFLNQTYFFTNYTTVVTLVGTSCKQYTVTTNSAGGKLVVYVWDALGVAAQCAFQFSTFKSGV